MSALQGRWRDHPVSCSRRDAIHTHTISLRDSVHDATGACWPGLGRCRLPSSGFWAGDSPSPPDPVPAWSCAAMCPLLSGCGAPGQLETPVGLGGCPRGKVPGLWLDPAEDQEDDAPSHALAPPPLPASVPWRAQVHQKVQRHSHTWSDG